MAREGFVTDFRRFFLRGLAAALPTLVTLWLLVQLFRFIHEYLGKYVNEAIKWVSVQFASMFYASVPMSLKGPDPVWDDVTHAWDEVYHLDWIGLVLAFVVIYIFGRFVASWIGRGIWRMVEQAFFRLPVVKQIYPHVKQVTDFLFSDRHIEFSRVVMVEYPRRGLYSLGFVTGAGIRTVNDAVRGEMLTVFIPSSPTPVTGYTIVVRRDEVIDLPISIDEALRFTISGGVIAPLNQKLSEAVVERARRSPDSLPARSDRPQEKEIKA